MMYNGYDKGVLEQEILIDTEYNDMTHGMYKLLYQIIYEIEEILKTLKVDECQTKYMTFPTSGWTWKLDFMFYINFIISLVSLTFTALDKFAILVFCDCADDCDPKWES